MKLIDVLVKELPALGGWPEEADFVFYSDSILFFVKERFGCIKEIIVSSMCSFDDVEGHSSVDKEEYFAALDAVEDEDHQTKELFHASYHYHYKAFGSNGSLLVEGSNWLQLDYDENPAGKVQAKYVYDASRESAMEHSKQTNPDVVNVILVSINKL